MVEDTLSGHMANRPQVEQLFSDQCAECHTSSTQQLHTMSVIKLGNVTNILGLLNVLYSSGID